MSLQLSGHFTYKRLLRFVVSPVLMMICTSIYGVIDGFFVSNYIGKLPFAAVNFIMPVDLVAVAVGFMLGNGGNALISKKLGQGKERLANQYFSLLVYVSAVIGVLLSAGGFFFMPQIVDFLGASDQLREPAIIYGKILLAGQLFYVWQNSFQSFFIAAGKPDLSLRVSVLAGVANAVCDFLFIVVWEWGLPGAALATVLGQMVGGVLPLAYFARKNSSMLRLGAAPLCVPVIAKAFSNGSSEMVSVLSGSIVGILYNRQLLAFAGEDGVAAYGAIMYVDFIFMAIFLGYASSSAPLISFQYGAKNWDELKNLFAKSIILMLAGGVIITVISECAAEPLLDIFVGYDEELLALTVYGFRVYMLAFLFMGVNIFGSALFTALNNGMISAAVSFLRTLVFETSCVLLLPLWLGADGIWLSIVIAEILAVMVTGYFIFSKKKIYGYL